MGGQTDGVAVREGDGLGDTRVRRDRQRQG